MLLVYCFQIRKYLLTSVLFQCTLLGLHKSVSLQIGTLVNTIWPNCVNFHIIQPELADASARKDYFQDRRAELSSCPCRCPAVPTAVHVYRRYLVLTKTAVFFIRSSTYSWLLLSDFLLLDFIVLRCRGSPTCNDLLVDVTLAPSLLTLRKRLKLFRISYPGLVL